MDKKHSRVIGTTESAISNAESELGFGFPPSFRNWILENNTRGIEDVTIFPVYDERDPRKTWDSIVRNFNDNWLSSLRNYGEICSFEHLLPFGEFGTGDYYCFDFSNITEKSEAPVVIWFHETGKTEHISSHFAQFAMMAEKGKLD